MRALARLSVITLLLVTLWPGLTAAQSAVITRGQTQCRQVALTFDAGATSVSAQGILNALSAHHSRSTFFLTGGWTDDFPSVAAMITAMGHEVGNHTNTHPHMPEISTAQMRTEFRSAEAKIVNTSGESPRPFWRPPYGEYNNTVLLAAEEEGYPWTLMWEIDTIDWQHPPADVIVDRVLSRVQPGAVVLMHMGGNNTAEAVGKMLPELEHRGYMMVTVGQVLGLTRADADFGGRVVYVQSGDTLNRIASCFNTTSPVLAAANDISNPNLISPAQRIYVPLRDEVTVQVNGNWLRLATPARVIDGRTLVHVRATGEALGAAVGWEEAGQRITLTKGSTTIVMSIGSKNATVNGTPVDLDVAPFIVDDRTQVPIRFVAENLGATVNWDENSRTAQITQ